MTLLLVEKHNWEKNLRDILSCNSDWVGDNGEEYTSEEALESGFTSDFEYAVSLSYGAEFISESWVAKVKYVLALFEESEKEYYDDLQYEILPINGDSIVVSLYTFNR